MVFITEIDGNKFPCKYCDLQSRCKKKLKKGFQIEYNNQYQSCYTTKKRSE